MPDPLPTRPLDTLAEGVRDGTVTPTELVEASLERIDRLGAELNAFVTVTPERARSAARDAERALREGDDLGPLHGIPIAIKDSRPVAGVRHTWGSKLLSDNVADVDDGLVTRLRDAGAIVVGKTNLPEFALGGGTDNLLVGPTANPFDHDKMVGGSSGGSAAAVAAGLVPVAQGEDGGGSLRMPASTCGLYTIKPTFGRVGEFVPGRTNAFRHTPMQTAGALTRSVADAALMLDVLGVPHRRDPFSLPATNRSYRSALSTSIDDVSVAVSPNLDLYPIDDRVERTVLDAAQVFESAGATVERVSPSFDHTREEITDAFMRQSNVVTTGFGDQLAADYGIDLTGSDRADVLPYVAEQFEAGRHTTALEYRAADEVRTDVFDTVEDVFEAFDLLVSATLTVLPFDKELLREYPGPTEVGGTRLDDSRWGPFIDWRTTQVTNMTGHPAASIPAGFSEGLPVGMEIVGPRFEEASVLAASETFERLRPWRDAYERIV